MFRSHKGSEAYSYFAEDGEGIISKRQQKMEKDH